MRGPVSWPGDPPIDPAGARRWRELGLTDEEFERILAGLGRLPTWCELGMFSVAWSEHCAYKHSRLALRRLPTSGGRVLVGPGENAGVLDIGDGWAVAVRLESHNHPSFVEPYQGAATGVGGIVRDVLAAGARPVALLNALRFGLLSGHPKNRYLFEEVVAGIAGYGNAIGVPTVGGEVAFDPAYDTNPMVNVMCVGLVRRDRIARARAAGPGNPVYLVGSRTGRDGIHGAGLLASRTFSDDPQQALRPRVQVGDPFMEKLLIEACLEALETGAVVGIQDLGAAGITAAASELAARGGTGMAIDLDAVPCREPGMTPFEVLLSESQERMMLVVERARAGEVEAVLNRWKLPWASIGTVTEDGRLRFWMGGRLVADVPAALLAEGAPRYEAPGPSRPAAFGPHPSAGRRLPLRRPGGGRRGEASALDRRLRERLASPAEGWRGWIYTQFDYMVGLRTVLPPGHDAAVLRIPENGRYVALSLDGAVRLARQSAYLAAAAAVLEGARNVAAVGADPVGITNGINLGSPERPEVMQQLADCVEGMADACRALGIPVTGGNVSLYNETGDRSIPPTVIVGTVGLLDGPGPVPSGFQRPGDQVVLIGEPQPLEGGETGAPPPDFEAERRAIALVARAGRDGLLASCHDVGDGGLAVALAECALLAGEGADGVSVRLELGHEEDVAFALFSMGGACWVASVRPGRMEELASRARQCDVPLCVLGTVEPGRIRVLVASSGEVVLDEATSALRPVWEAAFERKPEDGQPPDTAGASQPAARERGFRRP